MEREIALKVMLLKVNILICQCLKKVLAGDINLCVLKNKKNKITGEKQINIQLGKEKGKGLEIFNQNLKKYEVIEENKQ